jgi:hypothetical protein
MDSQETTRAISSIAIVGNIDGYDVIRRNSALDIVRARESTIQALIDALWKACGDDEKMVNDYLFSQLTPEAFVARPASSLSMAFDSLRILGRLRI